MTDPSNALRASIQRSGYYPELVGDSVERALADEPVVASVVHQEATLDEEMELRRHVTVLVLTPSRLLVCHTDEHAASEAVPHVHATTTCEAVPLSRVSTVATTTLVTEPGSYTRGTAAREITLSVAWGLVGRIEIEPATCGDEQCEADHGYTGVTTPDDLSIRISEAADGAEAVAQTVSFAADLSQAAARFAVLPAAG